MLSQEFLERLKNFLPKIPAKSALLKSYLRKLSSEGLIQSYKETGDDKYISFIVGQESNLYKVYFESINKKFFKLHIINVEDEQDIEGIELW